MGSISHYIKTSLYFLFLAVTFSFPQQANNLNFYWVKQKYFIEYDIPLLQTYDKKQEPYLIFFKFDNFMTVFTLSECPYVGCRPYNLDNLFLYAKNSKDALNSKWWLFQNNLTLSNKHFNFSITPFLKNDYKQYKNYLPYNKEEIASFLASKISAYIPYFKQVGYNFKTSSFRKIQDTLPGQLLAIYKKPDIKSKVVFQLKKTSILYITKRTNKKQILFQHKGEWLAIVDNQFHEGYVFSAILKTM